MTETIRQAKRILREQTLQDIRNLNPAYAAGAGRRIVDHVLSLPAYRDAGTVFCYVGMGHEINTAPLLTRILSDGKRLAVPVCVARSRMEARQIFSMEELHTSNYGIREPALTAPLVTPEEIDFAVIPCITCSRSGERLGHGGGYYDIYFEHYQSIPSVMLCREKVLRDTIPLEAHDIRFGTVVTEDGVFHDGLMLQTGDQPACI